MFIWQCRSLVFNIEILTLTFYQLMKIRIRKIHILTFYGPSFMTESCNDKTEQIAVLEAGFRFYIMVL